MTAPLARALRRRRGAPAVIRAARRALDRLLLATLVVTTWHKIHWSPGAGDVTLEDILALLFLGALRRRPLHPPRRAPAPRRARARCSRMPVLEVVYLGGFFDARRTSEALTQYAKGMTKFALHFAFLIVRHRSTSIDRGERLLRRTIGAFVLGLVAQLRLRRAAAAREGRRRRQPRQARHRAAHVRAGQRRRHQRLRADDGGRSRAATSRTASSA